MSLFKKIASSILIASFLLLVGNTILAAPDKNLETVYPKVSGEAPTTVKTNLGDYIKYIFNFSILIAGLVAFGALVAGGVQYLTSAGDPSKIEDSKDRITSAFLGLIIILSAYLILVTINPQLTLIKIKAPGSYTSTFKPLSIVGAYLIKDGYKDGDSCIPDVKNSNCLRIIGDVVDLGIFGFNDTAKKIYLSDNLSTSGRAVFYAILHEDSDFQGQCKIFITPNSMENIPGKDAGGMGIVDKPSSANVFLQGEPQDGSYVKLCKQPNFEECTMLDKNSSPKVGLFSIPKPLSGYGLDNQIRSIKIEGNYVVVLFENSDSTGICEVFRNSVADLKNNPIGRCGWTCFKIPLIGKDVCLWGEWQPCASAAGILPAQ